MNSNLSKMSDWTSRRSAGGQGPAGGGIAGGGHGGDNGDMELSARVKSLEDRAIVINDRLIKIETWLEHMPTTAELHKEISSQTWKFVLWVSTVSTALVAATFFMAKHLS